MSGMNDAGTVSLDVSKHATDPTAANVHQRRTLAVFLTPDPGLIIN